MSTSVFRRFEESAPGVDYLGRAPLADPSTDGRMAISPTIQAELDNLQAQIDEIEVPTPDVADAVPPTETIDGIDPVGGEDAEQIELVSESLQQAIDELYAADRHCDFRGRTYIVDRPILLPTSQYTPGVTTFKPATLRNITVKASSGFQDPESGRSAVLKSVNYDWLMSNGADQIWIQDFVSPFALENVKVHGGCDVNDDCFKWNISIADGGESVSATPPYIRDGILSWGSCKMRNVKVGYCHGVGIRNRRGNNPNSGAFHWHDDEVFELHGFRITHCWSGFIAEASSGGNADGVVSDGLVERCRDVGLWFNGGAWNINTIHSAGMRSAEPPAPIEYGNVDGTMPAKYRGCGIVLGTGGFIFGGPLLQADNCRIGVYVGSAGARADSVYVQCLENFNGYNSQTGVLVEGPLSVGYLYARVNAGRGLDSFFNKTRVDSCDILLGTAAICGARVLGRGTKIHGAIYGNGVTGVLGVRFGELGYAPYVSNLDLSMHNLTTGIQYRQIGTGNQVVTRNLGSVTTMSAYDTIVPGAEDPSNDFLELS